MAVSGLGRLSQSRLPFCQREAIGQHDYSHLARQDDGDKER